MGDNKDIDSILSFWFPSTEYQEFWFDGSVDGIIRDDFYDLLLQAETGHLEDWKKSPNGKLALIILIDQFSRNIYRNSNFRKNDHLILPFVLQMIENDDDMTYPFYQRIFIWLPLRHTHQTKYLNTVLERLNSCMIKGDSLMERFKMATLRDFTKAIDTIQIFSNYCDEYSIPCYEEGIIDKDCEMYRDVQSRESLLELNTKVEKYPIYKTILTWINDTNYKNICVSLSGGVDSMVLLWIFLQLQLRGIISTLIAVHVDYGNRDVSMREADFVKRWCEFLHIPLLMRRIDHMRRHDNIDRMFYESETKNIRFALYRYAIDNYHIEATCLGHHNDDLAENIIMNCLKGSDILDLNGMDTVSIQHNVNICRPMLANQKNDIYNVSRMFGIPYMCDTTPENCFRGVLRNKIISSIREFDEGMLKNIVSIGKQSNEWKQVVHMNIINPIIRSIKKYKLGFSIEIPHNEFPFSFWMTIFIKMFHSQEIKMMSHKNVRQFMTWNKKRNGKIQLSNGYDVQFYNDKLYFYNRSDFRKINNTVIEIKNDNNEINIIGWKIIITKVNNLKLINKITLEEILNGHFVYTEPINDSVKITTVLEKRDSTRKLFTRLQGVCKYIPKVTGGTTGDLKNIVKIEIYHIDT